VRSGKFARWTRTPCMVKSAARRNFRAGAAFLG
jgi:hypothetical protein